MLLFFRAGREERRLSGFCSAFRPGALFFMFPSLYIMMDGDFAIWNGG